MMNQVFRVAGMIVSPLGIAVPAGTACAREIAARRENDKMD
jgi:hypothetical protein